MRVVLSPHVDDAIFSVGEHLADGVETLIACPFAAVPDAPAAAAKYERLLQEHEDACASLGVGRLDGPFVDDAHRTGRDHVEIEAWLADVIDTADETWVPAGIVHPDHVTVTVLTLSVLKARPPARVVFYEELPYRVLYPSATDFAVGKLRNRRGPLQLRGRHLALDAKRAAVECYRSQLDGDEIRRCLYVPERTWEAA